MRKRGRTDSNQQEVVKKLRQIPGVSVAITSAVGNGYPDLNIGLRGKTFLVELKDGAKFASEKRLTPEEEKFKAGWTGGYYVAETFEEVLKIIGL